MTGRISCSTNSIRQVNKSGKGFAGINLANSSQNRLNGNHCYSTVEAEMTGPGIDENGSSDWNIVASNNVCGAQRLGENSAFVNNLGA